MLCESAVESTGGRLYKKDDKQEGNVMGKRNLVRNQDASHHTILSSPNQIAYSTSPD